MQVTTQGEDQIDDNDIGQPGWQPAREFRNTQQFERQCLRPERQWWLAPERHSVVEPWGYPISGVGHYAGNFGIARFGSVRQRQYRRQSEPCGKHGKQEPEQGVNVSGHYRLLAVG